MYKEIQEPIDVTTIVVSDAIIDRLNVREISNKIIKEQGDIVIGIPRLEDLEFWVEKVTEAVKEQFLNDLESGKIVRRIVRNVLSPNNMRGIK